MGNIRHGIVMVPGPLGTGGQTTVTGGEEMNPEEWITGVPTPRFLGLLNGASLVDCNGSVNSIVLAPVQVQNPLSVTSMAIRVRLAAAAGGLARMALYEQTQPGFDLSLIFEGSDFSTETVGVKSQPLSKTLTPGKMYWAGIKTDDKNFRWYMPQGRYSNNVLGFRNDMSNDSYTALRWTGTVFSDPLPPSLQLGNVSLNFNVGVAVRFSA